MKNLNLSIIYKVWEYLGFNMWWLGRMVELGELSKSEAGYLICKHKIS
jgi:hypothetical protein